MTFRRDPNRIRALRDLTYLEIEGPRKTERRIETLAEYANMFGGLVDFDLGSDPKPLWTLVSTRAANRAAEAARATHETSP